MVSVVNERVIFAVILLLVAVAGYGLGFAVYQPQILRLESEVSNLQSEVSTLTTDYANLNTTYNELQANYNTLNISYNELEGNYSLLTETVDVRLIGVCTPAWLIQIVSGSMQPTLKIGDVVVVRKVPDLFEWNVTIGYTNGTIVAFWGGPVGLPRIIIVHRLIEMGYWLEGGTWFFRTHGDNNTPLTTEQFSEEYLIGEVITVISESS